MPLIVLHVKAASGLEKVRCIMLVICLSNEQIYYLDWSELNQIPDEKIKCG